MLTTEEVQAITLKSKFIYDHGNKSYFANGINAITDHIQKYIPIVLNSHKHGGNSYSSASAAPPVLSQANMNTINTEHLNYFVRYKCRENEEEFHRWSQIEQVVLISAGNNNNNNNTSLSSQKNNDGSRNSNNNSSLTIETNFGEPSSTQQNNNHTFNNANVPYIVWKNRLFWIALKVKFESKHVSLVRLSASTPTDDEVMGYCQRQQVADPLGGVFEETQDALQQQHSGEAAGGIPGEAPATAELRQYLPAKRQIELLKLYKVKFFAEHSWTQDEIEETRRLQELYAGKLNEQQQREGEGDTHTQATGDNATSGAGRKRERDHGGEGPLQHSTTTATTTTTAAAAASTVSYVGAAAAPIQAALRRSEQMRTISAWGLLQAPPEGNKPQATLLSSQQQQQHHAAAAAARTISPFLPLKLRKQFLHTAAAGTTLEADNGGGGMGMGSTIASASSFSAFDTYNSYNHLNDGGGSGARHAMSASMETTDMLGAAPRSHLTQSQNESIPTENFLDRVPQTTQEWSDAATTQEKLFYHYIKDDNRSAFLNKTAKITAHNHHLNKKIRLVGIENEKRMNRIGNLLESGMLWVSDDRKRSEMAKKYKDTVDTGSEKKKEDGGKGKGKETTATAADAGGGAASANSTNNMNGGEGGGGGDDGTGQVNNNGVLDSGNNNINNNTIYANLTAQEIQFLKTYKEKKSKQEILFSDAIPDEFVHETENLIRTLANEDDKNEDNKKNKIVQSQLVFRTALRNIQRQE